ncbi:MAG: hypothetical protein ABWZ57_17350 [Mesorhizobium sp.]|jgi:hypothetical protein
MSAAVRGLGWAHGVLAVQRLGAMMAPLTFVLGDGRQVSPLHVAPWADAPEAAGLPGILARLRGEWPCVPFGYSVPAEGWPADWAETMGPPEADEEVHGHASNHEWAFLPDDGASLRLALDYPAASPVARVERTVTPDPDAPAVELSFSIAVRRPCRLPIGLHPVFRLPSEPGAARLEVDAGTHGRTYPGTVEPGAALFSPDRRFASLTEVPARAGGSVDAGAVPFAAAVEELLQLEGTGGRASLANHAEGYRATLTWQAEHFPSLLLWYSNRGRQAPPWSGRHLALGIEPVCSPFGLGPETARADNPLARSGVATALDFAPDRPFTTRYRIEAEPL